MSALSERNAQIHMDSVEDTKVCYSSFIGAVLTCSWCGHQARGKTKRAALPGMQAHYDQVCGSGRVVVSGRVQG